MAIGPRSCGSKSSESYASRPFSLTKACRTGLGALNWANLLIVKPKQHDTIFFPQLNEGVKMATIFI